MNGYVHRLLYLFIHTNNVCEGEGEGHCELKEWFMYLAEVISSMSDDKDTRNAASSSSRLLALSFSTSSESPCPCPWPEGLRALVAVAAVLSSAGGMGRLVRRETRRKMGALLGNCSCTNKPLPSLLPTLWSSL